MASSRRNSSLLSPHQRAILCARVRAEAELSGREAGKKQPRLPASRRDKTPNGRLLMLLLTHHLAPELRLELILRQPQPELRLRLQIGRPARCLRRDSAARAINQWLCGSDQVLLRRLPAFALVFARPSLIRVLAGCLARERHAPRWAAAATAR